MAPFGVGVLMGVLSFLDFAQEYNEREGAFRTIPKKI